MNKKVICFKNRNFEKPNQCDARIKKISNKNATDKKSGVILCSRANARQARTHTDTLINLVFFFILRESPLRRVTT